MSIYIQAVRPQTLLVSISVWIVGIFLSFSEENSLNGLLNGVILFCMLCLQIAVNFFNDILDALRGKDTSIRLGPVRVVSEGLLDAKSLKKSAFLVLLFAFLSGSFLVLKGGVFILLIGGVGLFMTYFYSGPPIDLAERGLSEVFVFLFFGLLAVFGIFYLNILEERLVTEGLSLIQRIFYFNWEVFLLSVPAIIPGTQIGFLSVSLLIVNHLRDQKEDFQTGKRTWVVRRGRTFGLFQWGALVVSAYAIGGVGSYFDFYPQSFLFSLILLPFYFYLFFKIKNSKPSKKYNNYLALTAFAQFLFSIALALGFVFEMQEIFHN